MATKKLYKVRLRDLFSSSDTNYSESFVVATNPAEAYRKVRTFLDKEDLGIKEDRELESVWLVAEADNYPDCRTMLFL